MTMTDDTLRLLDQLTEERRTELSGEFYSRNERIRQCSQTMLDTIATIRGRGWNTHERIWNACLFLNDAAYDHSILIFDLACERNEWRRSLAARSLALLLFEVSEDIPAVFGKDFRASMDALDVPADLKAAVSTATKEVSSFFHQHRSMLKEIRVAAAAHRDHDAVALHETIERMDLLTMLSAALDLGNLLNDLAAAAQAVMVFTSSVHPPEAAPSLP
jgi:hypothetical protein